MNEAHSLQPSLDLGLPLDMQPTVYILERYCHCPDRQVWLRLTASLSYQTAPTSSVHSGTVARRSKLLGARLAAPARHIFTDASGPRET
jgi:hypothetical protein